MGNFIFLPNKKTINSVLCTLLFLFFTFSVAQVPISGTVSDVNGYPLSDVEVYTLDLAQNAITDVDGTFEIEVSEGAILVFNLAGYKQKQVSFTNQTVLNVTLEDDIQLLEETVVIGYGTQKKSDVNSSISTIKAEDISDLPQVSVDQMMQGKAAGVVISNNSGQPGSSTSVNIRGLTSLSGTNEPLYIIDGVPVMGDARNSSTSGRPLAGNDFESAGIVAVSPLSMVNPNDIESISVLKDASATAIYGSRASNGVVLITTKSGKKGKGKLTYDMTYAVSEQSKFLETMNLQQYATLQNALADEYNVTPRPEFAHPELLGSGTDWQRELFRTAAMQSHQLSFSGGSENSNYYISGGYLDQEGTIIGSGFKRYNLKSNLDAKVNDWLKVGLNIIGTVTNENITLNSSQNGVISLTLLQAPDNAVYNSDGSFMTPPSNDQNIFINNPVALAVLRDNKLIRKSFLGNFYSEISPIKNLTYRFEFGANTEFAENSEFTPEASEINSVNAQLWERRNDFYSWNIKNLLTYHLQKNKHDLTVMVGQEANESVWKGLWAYGAGFLSNDIQTISVAEATTVKALDYKGDQALNSYFGRLIYDFGNRYSVTASIRFDGSSKFDPYSDGKQWGEFYGVSGSWKLSNEKFMEWSKPFLNDVKLRAGYGETGNQQVPNYLYGSSLSTYQSGLGTGFLVSRIANPNLTWESAKQSNFAVDFSIFDKRLSATVEYYVKNSEGFLLEVPLPLYLTGGNPWTGGMASPYANIGEMENKGWDVTLNYSTKSSGNFGWNSTLVFSTYKNKIIELPNGLDLTGVVYTNDYTTAVVTSSVEGQPMSMFYGLEYAGIIRDQGQLDNAPLNNFGTSSESFQLGDALYVDQNGDGLIDENDMVFIGNPHPDFTYGFTNQFSYKGIELSIFLQGSYGNDVLNLTRRAATMNTMLYTNQLAEAIDFWSPENTDASLPRPVANLSHSNNRVSSRFVEDGSYLRIQNVTLGYNFPYQLVDNLGISKLRVFMGIQNLYTFTDYSGYDPEVGSFNQNATYMNIDNGRYPTPRTFTMGLNVEF